ncbi:hypothetical protein CKA32_000212 [Geitlerinema sp. FC II]|nr:hypothetical protein CKA32_000212 [Geitlerinema sp. FC II]
MQDCKYIKTSDLAKIYLKFTLCSLEILGNPSSICFRAMQFQNQKNMKRSQEKQLHAKNELIFIFSKNTGQP